MGLFSKKGKADGTSDGANNENLIHYRDFKDEEIEELIQKYVVMTRPKFSKHIDYLIDEIRRKDSTNASIREDIRESLRRYNMSQFYKSEKENTMAEEATKETSKKRDWKKTAVKVGKIALPIAGGVVVGAIGTALIIKKPWQRKPDTNVDILPEPEPIIVTPEVPEVSTMPSKPAVSRPKHAAPKPVAPKAAPIAAKK